MAQCTCGGEADREMKLWLATPEDMKRCEDYVAGRQMPTKFPCISYLMRCGSCGRMTMTYTYQIDGYTMRKGDILPGWNESESVSAKLGNKPEKPKKKPTSRRLF